MSFAHPREEIESIAKASGKPILSREVAAALDAQDELSSFRDRFHIPYVEDSKKSGDAAEHCVYLCGNSLGLQPKTTRALIEEDLNEWEKRGVEGHFHGPRPWAGVERNVNEPLMSILGAKYDHEVVAMNTLTTNVHLMMVSFFRPEGKRCKILMEAKAFPSDHYAVESQLRFHGLDPKECLIELKPRDGEVLHRPEDIFDVIEKQGDEIALIWLGCVQYYTGQAFEMDKIAAKGHEHGCVVGFDLAHAAGNLELKLHDWNVDFATFCSYKYLNSGPGSIAGVFVHDRHAETFARGEGPRFNGWWGHDYESRFDMPHEFSSLKGAQGWQLSNPCVLAMTSLLASVRIFEEATMARLRKKSVLITGYLEMLVDERLKGKVEILTPRDINQRGAQLSLKFVGKSLDAVADALSAKGVVCDKRRPDVIRVAPAPLYNTYDDVFRFVDIIVNTVD